MIEMKDVESTQLAKIGWAKDVLYVIFQGGNHRYEYVDVPEEIFKELESSESVGKTFNAKIKGVFAHTKHEIDVKIGTRVQAA